MTKFVCLLLLFAFNSLLAEGDMPKYTYAQWLNAIPKGKYGLQMAVAGISGNNYFAVFQNKHSAKIAVCIYDISSRSASGCSVAIVEESLREVNYPLHIVSNISSHSFLIKEGSKSRWDINFGFLLLPPPAQIQNKKVFLQIGFPDHSSINLDPASFRK